MSAVAVRHRMEYLAVIALRRLAGWAPCWVMRRVGTGIGLLFHAVDAAHRRLAVSQLQAAFPLRSPAECRRMARDTFIHFGQAVVVMLRTSTYSPTQLRRQVDVEGAEHVRTALAAGRGVIIFSGHFGYWELHGLTHALEFAPMSVLARPLDNPHLHGLLERIRRATGNHVIYRQGAMRRVLRALAANECVAILIDQHIQGADAVPADFFGRPAATTSALATLALRTGAKLVPAFAVPQPDGRCRLVYEPAIDVTLASGDAVLEVTQRCTDVLEMYVRRYPHYWLWMHRRWRDVGPTERLHGMFPAGRSDEGLSE